jgi:rare lipoprotein A
MGIVLCLYSCCCLFGGPPSASTYGLASYYGAEFHGKKTASGEIFNQWDYTCAHRKLPFGTRIKVTNVKNKKSVVVRVNDRGPWVRGRLIDLSYAAAKSIDIIGAGVARVKIEILK